MFNKKSAVLIFMLLICLFVSGCNSSESNSDKINNVELSGNRSFFDYLSVKMSDMNSTVIAEGGYDAANNILLLRFRSNGALYAYYNVPRTIYLELIHADSPGNYLNSYIRDKYDYELIESGEGYSVKALYNETSIDNATYAINTGTYKFHRKNCYYAEAKHVVFVSNSKDELEKLGYSPCKICEP